MHCFHVENHRQCIELAESDVSAVESRDASRAPASGSCEPALQSLHRRKFVWPGIEAVIEAYASHAEGDDSFVGEYSVFV